MDRLPPKGLNPHAPAYVPGQRVSDSKQPLNPHAPAFVPACGTGPDAANSVAFHPPVSASRQTAGLEPLALSAVACRGSRATRFEDLALPLVVHIVVAYLGIPGVQHVKALAEQYAHLRAAIDPAYVILATLERPIRVIALRDMLTEFVEETISLNNTSNAVIGPLSTEDESAMVHWRYAELGLTGLRDAQVDVAQQELECDVSLALVAELVRRNVPAVQPEHRELLEICDSILAGVMPELDADALVVKAQDIQLRDECVEVLGPVAREPSGGPVSAAQAAGIARLRTLVLGDAFECIARDFTSQAGLTFEDLWTDHAVSSVSAPGNSSVSSSSSSSSAAAAAGQLPGPSSGT